MVEPLVALKKLRELLGRLHTADEREKDAPYAAAICIVGGLKEVAGDTRYTCEKLGDLKWHMDAIFGADEDSGKGAEQHFVWASTLISALEGLDHFGEHGPLYQGQPKAKSTV